MSICCVAPSDALPAETILAVNALRLSSWERIEFRDSFFSCTGELSGVVRVVISVCSDDFENIVVADERVIIEESDKVRLILGAGGCI